MGRKLRFTNIPVLKPVREAEKYFIHDNGGIPFLVSIPGDGTVSIFGIDEEKSYRDDYGYYNWYYTKLIAKYKPTKIFIGKSVEGPLTSDGYYYDFGPELDGNTILLEVGPKKYIWIGNGGIYEFQAEAEIVEFQSPIGNNDVPYAFAIDKNRNSYLLFDKIIISDVPEDVNPHTWYYEVLKQKGGTPIKEKVIQPRLW